MRTKKLNISLLFVLSLFCTISCAKIGSPTGGAYDRSAPKLVSCSPKNNSIKFNGHSFEVSFDEYIELDNVNDNLIVSPPLKEIPTVKSYLRKMEVSFSDTLRANTTYIFDFGQSIKDFNEGNKLSSFVYSFSTGDAIDTLQYKGRVIDAYTLNPIKGEYVMLYKETDFDSIKHLAPSYLTRCDSSGNFSFSNIAQGQYYILAIDDENKNLRFDEQTESVAFNPQLIKATNYLQAGNDTSRKDSIITKKDSLIAKTESAKDLGAIMEANTLYFYSPLDTALIVSSLKFISPFAFQLSFQNPLTDSLALVFSYPKIENPYSCTDYSLLYSAKRDTLTIYSLNKTFDSIKCSLVYGTQKQDIEQYRDIPKNEKIKDTFTLSPPASIVAYFEPLLLKMSLPINDSTLTFKAFYIKDSVSIALPCKVYEKNHFYVQVGNKPFAQNSKGTIKIPAASFSNGTGQVNDSTSFNFSVDSPEQYGNLIFSITDSTKDSSLYKHYIFLLEDTTGKTIDTAFAQTNQKIHFTNLKEGTYRIKIIEDRNNNHRWDRGSFTQRILPERVFYFDKTIPIRKNWDIEASSGSDYSHSDQ